MDMNWITFLQVVAAPVVGGVFYFLGDKIRSLYADLEKQRDALHALEVNVAQTYATRAELEKMEHRILQALDRMEQRVLAALSPALKRTTEFGND